MKKNIFIQSFESFKEGSEAYGKDIAFLVNCVLLSLAYFIGVGLTWIGAKISKKDFLELKTEKNKESYWEDMNKKERKMEDFYRQF